MTECTDCKKRKKTGIIILKAILAILGIYTFGVYAGMGAWYLGSNYIEEIRVFGTTLVSTSASVIMLILFSFTKHKEEKPCAKK